MTERKQTAEEILRDDILAVGIEDFVSLAAVQGFIDDGGLADSPAERQQLVVDTVRSMLAEDLVEVGGIPSPSSPAFKTWPGTVEEVMTQLTDRFVAHYEDRYEWAFKVWLNLTTKGRHVLADPANGRGAKNAQTRPDGFEGVGPEGISR